MSEYQRYEFMTSDRPLTRGQLAEVNRLSSHIEATSSHALIEYDWGNFKHDAIEVLHSYFDGFLYWANWGAPQLAFRIPRGVLAADLLAGYDFADFAAFTRHADCDILSLHFVELEGPDEWVEYELGSLMPIREELMDGDTRALYIAWLAAQPLKGTSRRKQGRATDAPPIPPAFGALTAAQQTLAELLRVPQEMLAAVARHSAKSRARSSGGDVVDITAWIELLPPERRMDYLVRLAQHEPGLSRLFIRELRALGPANTAPPSSERVDYETLLTESHAIKDQMDRKEREREERARQQRMQHIHDRQQEYWRDATQAVERGSGYGYDDATRLLVELREVASHFEESPLFEDRFRNWVEPHLSRPAFVRRMQENDFPLPH